MLALLVLGYVSLTLNWFNIASAFTPISEDLGVSFEQLAMLIALFVLGYGSPTSRAASSRPDSG